MIKKFGFLMKKYSLLSIVISICLLISVTFLPMTASAATSEPSLIVAADEFDILNNWIYEEGSADAENGKLWLSTGVNSINSSTDGYLQKLITRPISEKQIDQSVTVEVSCADIATGSFPAVWLRVQEDNRVKSGYVLVYDNDSNNFGIWALSTDGKLRNYVANLGRVTYSYFGGTALNDTLRITFSATGTNPTVLTTTTTFLSNKWTNINNVIVENSIADLQNAGTVGLSAISADSSNTMNFDNFIYKSTSINEVVTDNFDRVDSETVSNGWVKPHTYASYAIADNQLLMTAGKSYTQAAYRLQRPYSESGINQTVAITVSAEEMAAMKYPALWLRLQENPEPTRAVGYFFLFNGSNMSIGKALSTDATANNLTTIKSDRFSPDLSQYNAIRFEFSAVSDGLGSTTLTLNAYCDLISGNDWVKTVTCTDNTAELQNAGTVAVSGYQINNDTNTNFLMDDFIYTREKLSDETEEMADICSLVRLNNYANGKSGCIGSYADYDKNGFIETNDLFTLRKSLLGV